MDDPQLKADLDEASVYGISSTDLIRHYKRYVSNTLKHCIKSFNEHLRIEYIPEESRTKELTDIYLLYMEKLNESCEKNQINIREMMAVQSSIVLSERSEDSAEDLLKQKEILEKEYLKEKLINERLTQIDKYCSNVIEPLNETIKSGISVLEKKEKILAEYNKIRIAQLDLVKYYFGKNIEDLEIALATQGFQPKDV